MCRGRSYALGAACLILIAPGCAGPARRAGMATGGVEGVMPRLFRPADPIARLGPAPVAFGPMADPGSYSPAVAGTRTRPLGGGSGPLTVGGGQLADRGSATTGRPADGPSPTAMASVGDPERPPTPASPSESPSSRAENGWPIVPETEPDRLAEAGDVDPAPAPAPSLDGPEVASRSASLPPAEPRSDAMPMLADGIDLEAYAAPPVASDPDARLASDRRPIAFLRNARSALLAGSTDPEPDPEPDPRSNPDPAEPTIEPEPSDVPGLPDLPEIPEEPSRPTRDDVRPASIRSLPVEVERPVPSTDPDLAIDAPSPPEPSRPGLRLRSRLRQLRERIGRDRGPVELRSRPIASAGPTSRWPRIFGREDVDWLDPGG